MRSFFAFEGRVALTTLLAGGSLIPIRYISAAGRAEDSDGLLILRALWPRAASTLRVTVHESTRPAWSMRWPFALALAVVAVGLVVLALARSA